MLNATPTGNNKMAGDDTNPTKFSLKKPAKSTAAIDCDGNSTTSEATCENDKAEEVALCCKNVDDGPDFCTTNASTNVIHDKRRYAIPYIF